MPCVHMIARDDVNVCITILAARGIDKPFLVHRQFLEQLLGVRKSTTTHIVLAEFGRFPLQMHFWQQNLRYHNRVRALPNSRLDKLALIDGFWDINPPHRVEALSGNWRSVRRFTDTHGQQIV